MAFVPWKDRVTSTPHRYKLTQVSADTYDLTAVPGAIGEAGTPVNAANLNKLIQRDGDDIKDTVTTFAEASTRANIETGESTATLFGKIKKYFTDLKTHAFTTPSTAQGTGTTTVPSDKLLTESSFARVFKSLTEINSVFTGDTAIPTVYDAMPNNSIAIFSIGTISGAYPEQEGTCEICKVNDFRGYLRYTKKLWNTTTNVNMYFGTLLGTSGGASRWSGWKKLIDDSTAQTITGVKTYTASPIVPTTPSGSSAAVSKSYADSVGFARVYRSFADLGIPNSSTIAEIHAAMINRSKALIPVSTYDHPAYGNTGLELPNAYFYVLEAIRSDNERLTLKLVGKASNSSVLYHYEAMYWNYGTTDKFTGWKRIINDEDAQTITGIKTFATGATPLITDAPTTDLMAVNKAYADGLIAYDKVIRTQAEFEELIASPTWLGAVSVALVGQFTYSEANNRGIKVPNTVKQIHGFNSAKITVTNFKYNETTAKGGLWYDTLPTTLDYSIRDLEVSCDGSGLANHYGFRNCTNLTNCTGTGTGATGGAGFYSCTNLTNCTGTGTGTAVGRGFDNCKNLTNCTGTGTGQGGYGFYDITTASNCCDGGSLTNMWGGRNKNIDLDTCRKTLVEVTSGELTTLNT